jgi:hypothetical protein
MDEKDPHVEIQQATHDQTQESDRNTLRGKINLTWEFTQAAIAVLVVVANIAAAFSLSHGSELLANAFFLVIGFYFGRTNHTRPGMVKGD